MKPVSYPGLNIKVFLLAVSALLISINGMGQMTADFSASNTSICSGSTITFTDHSTGISDLTAYDWNFGEGASPALSTGKGPHVVYYDRSGKSTVSLTITDGESVTKTKTNYITINAVPPTPVVSAEDNCDGTSVLSTTAGGTLLWSTMDMSSSIRVSASGVYTVTTTVNGCESLPGSGTAIPKMSPPRPVESVDCSSNSKKTEVNILSPLGAEYEYRLDDGKYETAASFSNVQKGSHTITVRNAWGCTTTGNYFEVACDCDNGATVTLSSTSGYTCSKTAVTVSGNTFGGSATWTRITEDGDGSVSPTWTSQSPFAFTYTPKSGDTGKTVTITVRTYPDNDGDDDDDDDDDCVVAKETYLLTVHPIPSEPGIGKIIQPTCSEQTASVMLNDLPSTGTWSLERTPGGVTTTGNGTKITIPNLSTGTYNYKVTSETGCVSKSSDNVTIAKQPSLDPPEVGTVSPPTCTVATGSVKLNNLPETGEWTLIQNPGSVISTGSGTSKTIYGLSPGTYSFMVSNSAGCSSVPSSQVTIPLPPDIPLVKITNPEAVCSTGGVDLTTEAIVAGSTPGLTFTYWTDMNASVPHPKPANAQEGTYYIKGTTSAGCFAIKPVKVVADPMPKADAGPDQVLEYGFSTTLEAELSSEDESGIWSFISGTGEFVDPTYARTIVSGFSQNENELLWTVKRGVCPFSFDTVMIFVNDFKINNLITPNMDGRNDYFIIRGLSSLDKHELVVFDRRGVEVFTNEDYDNLWNGVDYNGNPLPEDTYFYVLKSENGNYEKGFIVIRR